MDTIHDEAVKHYSAVTKLVHYTSKFAPQDEGRPARHPFAARYHRLLSNFDPSDRFVREEKQCPLCRDNSCEVRVLSYLFLNKEKNGCHRQTSINNIANIFCQNRRQTRS